MGLRRNLDAWKSSSKFASCVRAPGWRALFRRRLPGNGEPLANLSQVVRAGARVPIPARSPSTRATSRCRLPDCRPAFARWRGLAAARGSPLSLGSARPGRRASLDAHRPGGIPSTKY